MDLLRVAASMALLLAIVPAVAARRSSPKSTWGWGDLLAMGFLRTALFLVFTGLLLGGWRLYLPGVVFSGYAAWILAMALLSSRKGWLYDRETWALGYGRLLRRLEGRGWLRQRLDRSFELSQEYLFVGLFVFAMFLQLLWYPLNHLHFPVAAGYSQSLSLGALLNGSVWMREASAALLAPVVLASGLDAATVVRFSAPLVYLLILGAIVYCTSAYSSSPWPGLLAVVLFWLYSTGPGKAAASALDGSLWATLALVLAAGTGRRSMGNACCGLLLAWLLGMSFPELALIALGSIAAGLVLDSLLHLMPQLVRKASVAAVLLLGVFAVAKPWQPAPPDGALQYESAARAAGRIAREFPRNRWLIVSPMHEAAFSIGRGWHTELPEFLERYPTETVGDPAFRLPFEVANVFVFVEKRPLPQVAKLGLPGTSGSTFYYSTGPGRTSMAYRAAALIASYSATHSGVTVFHEDRDLIVYQIRP